MAINGLFHSPLGSRARSARCLPKKGTSETLRLRLTVIAVMIPGSGTAPLFLQLMQDGVSLSAKDGSGNPVDQGGIVKLADVAIDKPTVHEFFVRSG